MDAYEQAMYGMAPSYELTEEEKKRLRMQQLIATGAALMAGRGNFVNNLGQAMLVGQNQGSEGMQDLRRNKLADAEIQYRNALIQEKQMTARAAAEKAAAQARAAQEYETGMADRLNANPSASFANRAPTVANAEKMAALDPRDVRLAQLQAAWDLAIQKGDEKAAGHIKNQMEFIRPKYNPTAVKVRGPDGKMVYVQTSDQGVPIEMRGYAPPPETQILDLKNKQIAIDKDTVAPGTEWLTGMTPSEAQNIGLRGAELGLSRQRLALENPQIASGVLPQKTLEFKFGKAPAEMQWTQDGKLVPMPGSNAEKEAVARQVSGGNVANKIDNVISTANKAIEQADGALGGRALSAGFPGYYAGMIPGTPGANLQASLDTIKANIGWRELQEMRDASKTGGALGQVAIQELNMLQTTLGNLDRTQDPTQLRENLRKVITHFRNAREAMQRAGIVGAGGQSSVGIINDRGVVNNDPLGLRR